MMYELITNGPHQNNLALYKCYDSGRTFYKKVSFSKKGNALLENEKKGYDWFLGGKGNEIRLIKKHFYELDIPEFKGRKFPSANGISANKREIERIISYYKKKWLEADEFAIHGDLALCNVIMDNKGGIQIVDWEHFHFADRPYFGFDIVNMLFIALCFEYRIIWNHGELLGGRKIRFIRKGTQDFLRKCYRQLIGGIDTANKIMDRPFQNSSNYLREFHDRFGLNVDAREKFALAMYPQSELEKLDLIVTKS